MKKFLVLALFLGICVFALMGCGGDDSANNSLSDENSQSNDNNNNSNQSVGGIWFSLK